jgi:hypothetical protein
MSQVPELVVDAADSSYFTGELGKTNLATCQVKLTSGALGQVTICTGINASTDPALAEIARSPDGLQRLHTVTVEGERIVLAHSVLYHDPALSLFALVVPHALRHRTVEEHRDVLNRLSDVGRAPAYVANLVVLCDSVGLQRHIADVTQQKQSAVQWRAELDMAHREIATLTASRDELIGERTAWQQSNAAMVTSPVAVPASVDAIAAIVTQVAAVESSKRHVAVGDYAVEMRTDLLDTAPSWLVTALVQSGGRLVTRMADGNAVLAMTLPEAIGEATLGWRLLMPRVEGYPIIVIALEVDGQVSTVYSFDPGNAQDVAALETLALTGCIQVVVASGGKHRRYQLVAPLAANVGYLLRAATEDLAALSASQKKQKVTIATQVVTDPAFDVTGAQHTEASEFRIDKLRNLHSVSSVRRAVALARRFAKASREDYLICTRGFPVELWRALRRDLLVAAVKYGIWMGPELAQVAVSDGLARSRRDLVLRMDNGFAAAKRQSDVFDLDADAAADNLLALQQEAQARGVSIHREPTPAAPDDEAVTSGEMIANVPPVNTKACTIDELLLLLDDKSSRVAAAIELCERGDGRAAQRVVESVKHMNRSEAVRVLGMSVRFGPAAGVALQTGLGSNKAYLRHGCALALAMLRTDVGTAAVIDLLLTEPTDIWREIARAIGQMGGAALPSLRSKLEDSALIGATKERTAWAMAHIAVRGGKSAITALTLSGSPAAHSALRALELLPMAAQDQVRIAPDATGTSPGREVTVNRAFSRRFFESLDTSSPAVQPAVVDTEITGSLVALNDDDLIFDAELLDDEDAMEVTEADLID